MGAGGTGNSITDDWKTSESRKTTNLLSKPDKQILLRLGVYRCVITTGSSRSHWDIDPLEILRVSHPRRTGVGPKRREEDGLEPVNGSRTPLQAETRYPTSCLLG